ncbi:MAG: hypothetical protein ACYDCQ_15635 [Dehalococcoidia bacterium]
MLRPCRDKDVDAVLALWQAAGYAPDAATERYAKNLLDAAP